MKYPKILALVPAGESFAPEALNEGIWLTEAHMNSIESSLETNAATLASVQGQLSAQALQAQQATAALATANQTITAREARIQQLEAENAELGRRAAGAIQPTSTETPDTPPVDPAKGKANKYETSVDREAKKYFD